MVLHRDRRDSLHAPGDKGPLYTPGLRERGKESKGTHKTRQARPDVPEPSPSGPYCGAAFPGAVKG